MLENKQKKIQRVCLHCHVATGQHMLRFGPEPPGTANHPEDMAP